MLRRILRAVNFNGAKSDHPDTREANFESFSDFAELEQVDARRERTRHKQGREEKPTNAHSKRHGPPDRW